MTDDPRPLVEGLLPLTARTEPWMERVLARPDECRELLDRYGSPVNLLDFGPLARNAAELVDAAAGRDVPLRVFVARKANKALGLVDAASAAGHGVDVASYAELVQCLERGVPADDLIVSAAVKSDELLRTAVEAGAVISLDNRDELDDVVRRSGADEPARVALRLTPEDPAIRASRFGLGSDDWLRSLVELGEAVAHLDVRGVHFHLDGYSAPERAAMLRASIAFVDRLREAGHGVGFVDMGGGVPMSYLDDEDEWRAFWRALADDADGRLTWRGDRLGLTDPEAARPAPAMYPYRQHEVRGEWLGRILDDRDERGVPVAEEVRSRGIELRCEPGRSVLDGCGMTIAGVAFRKAARDGTELIGLRMNRTQLRSTSVDVLLDPRWVRDPDGAEPGPPVEAFLVGAYCIEEELLLRRRLAFPRGVARGDVAAFVNTGGYLMHILESASHQLPLARNVVRTASGWTQDDIDDLPPTA